MEKHLPIILVALWGFGASILLLGLSRVLRGRAKRAISPIPFDGGKSPEGSSLVRFRPKFLDMLTVSSIMIAAVLILLPAIASLKDMATGAQGPAALRELILFISILSVSIAYLWKNGDFDWNLRGRR